ALAIGNASITATLGTLTSTPWPLAVTGMPPLQKIDVENASCLYPLVNAGAVPPAVAATMPPARTDVLPVPNCTDVVQIGSTLQFRAIGEFAGDSVQDITNQVQWQVTPADVGTGVTGLFTAVQAGTAQLTASLDGVASDPTQITVVTQPTVVAITIYAENSGIPVVSANTGGTGSAPAPVASCVAAPPDTAESVGPCCCPPPMLGIAAPCHCSYGLTVLVGDQLQFHATAQYDTGAWADVTNQVIWQSSTPQAASIDASGVMTALQAGDTSITAALGSVASDPDDVHVVDHATVQALSIYGEGQDLVVATGAQLFFHAVAGYDVGISREVTADATWQSSDDSVGGFDTPGVFTGRAAGAVQVWATLDGVQSNQISLQVFATSELSYCDPHNINRAVWTDNFNRVTLESDCASYAEPGVASLRYTVTEIQPHGGVFNPCLDLYVLQGHTPVRTIRNQGCGMPFLAPNAPNAGAETVKYQLLAFWDLKDDAGNPVAPGTYTIAGQFYLYYDPVVRLDITVLAPGQPTPAPITPEPTRSATPAAVCTPPPCPNGGTLVCPKGGQPIGTAGNGGLGCCPLGWFLYGCTFPDGGTGFACHDPALGCASSEVCGQGCDPVVTGACDECAGGCGYLCVLGTPAPTPTPEGACFTGPPNCAGGSFPSSQEACCKLSLSGAMPGVVSWCAITNFDPSSGTCGACADPCAGLPTPAPTPTVPSCCQSDVGGLCDMGVICPPPTPGGCALACDDRPCVSTCADGSLAKGTCSALTVDRGCQCAPDCAPGTPVPTPKPPPAQCTSLLPCAGKCTIFPTCTPGGACPQFVILGTCQLVADTCTCVSSNSTPLPLTTPTPQCTGAPCGGSCVISSPPFPCPPGAICNSTQGPDVPVQLGQCEVTTAGNCDCAPMDTPTPTPTPTGGQCSGVMCGGPCTICPPCTPDTVCPEIPCRLGACQADASGGCSCVADVSTPTPTPAQTCVTDSDCNDGNVCTADQCVGGVCEHACICLTTTGAQTCCAGPAALCVLPCGADAAGTCSGVCPAGASCESLPTAAPGCGCVSGVGGPCGGNLFTAPPVCATGLVCQQSLPDVTGVCVAPNCISLFASGCSQTSDCCEPCGNETHAPCGVCINGTCVGAP
ncbi:MAG TPA: Ig-like domain-containing protein, partial [Candidatus Acidoferrales bacterium]|nr:Ig-like domain-containing protein [Candidatus Acidoferrales bacterium]